MNSIFDNIERISNYTKKMSRRMGYAKPSAFMHIPKCAGTSIMTAVRFQRKASWVGHIDGPKTRQEYISYFFDNEGGLSVIEQEVNLYKFRQSLLIQLFKNNSPIISGHVPFLHSLKNEYPQYRFFTVVRNPLNRFISCFNFGLVKNQISLDIQPISEILNEKGINYVFDAFLDSEKGQFEANLLTMFFSECGKYSYNLQDAQKRAMNGILMFDYIGITEDLSKLQHYLHSENILPKHQLIQKVNVTENLTKNTQLLSLDNLTISQKSKLEQVCQLDIELYDLILSKYSK
ncbi:MAG: sulfotransferase family 2 domain-containing protein [Dolichospermum sp.]